MIQGVETIRLFDELKWPKMGFLEKNGPTFGTEMKECSRNLLNLDLFTTKKALVIVRLEF